MREWIPDETWLSAATGRLAEYEALQAAIGGTGLAPDTWVTLMSDSLSGTGIEFGPIAAVIGADHQFSITWQEWEWPNDRLLLPIVYNYRHALELVLKQAIRQAAECRQLKGDGDPGLTANALEAHFKQKQRHRLGPLAQQLAGMLAALNLHELPPDTSRLIQDLHQLDPTGEAFRYDGQLKTSAGHVDVPRLVQRFRAAFAILHGGILTALYEHASFLREIRMEYGP